ncbi:MAG: DUF342 domain-containing protein, partial [Candidatus Hydrogenedens sp.]
LEYLEGKLKEEKILEPDIIGNAKNRLLEIIEKGEIFENIILLRGKQPVPPVEGRIDWKQDFFAEGYEIDPETGMMDYRKPKAQLNVKAGQLLAIVILPKEGEDGVDVFGKIIPAPKPKPIRLRAGRNVKVDETNTRFFAVIDGRFRLEDDIIHIDNYLEIQGSVGLETGNISHLGYLVINKNVESDSVVHAEGDIEIKGYVEQADITTKGKLLVQGGITGGFEKKVIAKGTITAKYFLNLLAESEEGVYVGKEIDQSFVRSRGPVIVGGRIVGGEIIALGEVKADQIGSEACIKTTLVLGEDYFLPRYIKPFEDEKKEKEELLKKIVKGIKPLQNRWQSLPQDAKNAYVKLVQQAKTIKESIDELDKKINELTEKSRKKSLPQAIARKHLYPEVFIKIGDKTFQTREYIKGPVKVALVTGEIHLLAVS